MVNGREIPAIHPEESDKAQLAQDANDLLAVLLDDDDAVNSTAKNLDSLGKIGGMGKSDERLLLAQVLDISQRHRLSLSALLCEVVEGRFGSFRTSEANDEEEVSIQVAVIKCANGGVGVFIFANEDDIWGTGRNEDIGRLLDASINVDEADQIGVNDFAYADGSPVAASKGAVLGMLANGRVGEQFLQGLLRERGLARSARGVGHATKVFDEALALRDAGARGAQQYKEQLS